MIKGVNGNTDVIIEAGSSYLRPLSITLYTLSAAVSLAAFVYGVTLSYLQPQIWRNSIIRVVIVAQILNCVRFIFRIFLTDVAVTTDSACRAIFFLSDATSVLPVNLCVYCVVYLQLVIIHNVSPDLRWPRAVALTTATLLSVVPPSLFLYITPRAIGRESYCDFHLVPSTKEYTFAMYSYFAWAYLPGVIGTISVLTIAVYIWRTRRATRHVLLASTEDYGPSLAVERVGHTDTLYRALLTIIWFPITPVISLWFNAAAFSIYYYQQRTYTPIRFINIVLLCLQSLLLGLPLLVNPTVRDALAKQLQEQREARHGTRSTTRNQSEGTPPIPPLLLQYGTDQDPKSGQPADS